MSKLEELEKKLAETPDDIDLLIDLGIEYGISKHFKKAKDVFTRVIELDDTNVDAHYNLGVLYSKVFFEDVTKEELWEDLTDDEFAFELATQELTYAINLAPDFIQAYNDLGILYKIRHIDDEAIKLFKKSLEIDPNQEDIKEELEDLI